MNQAGNCRASINEIAASKVVYSAYDIGNGLMSQEFTVEVSSDAILVQDIMLREAMFIADMSATSVKRRFDLLEEDRLPHHNIEDGYEAANFQVGEGKWLGLWLNSHVGILSSVHDNSSWLSNTSTKQIGIDFSGSNYLVGVMSEQVSFASSFTNAEEDITYEGHFAVNDLELTSFYGGYHSDTFKLWAVSSSGTGTAAFETIVDGVTSSISSGVDYSMTGFGGIYIVNDVLDIGYELVRDVSFDFSDSKISLYTINTASRSKVFGRIDFGKWTRSDNSTSTLSWAPVLTFATRNDLASTSAGGFGGGSGIEITFSTQIDYKRIHLELGARDFSALGYKETARWLTFHLIPPGRQGLNFSLKHRLGSDIHRREDLFAAEDLESFSSNLKNDKQANNLSDISYTWEVETGRMKIFTRGESEGSAMVSFTDLFTRDAHQHFQTIGMLYNTIDNGFSLSARINGEEGSVKQFNISVDWKLE